MDQSDETVAIVGSNIKHPFCKQHFHTTPAYCMDKTVNCLPPVASRHLGLIKDIAHGTIGDENWIQTEELAQPTAVRSASDDGLMALWLSGNMKLKDIRDLERQLNECHLDKADLQEQMKRRKRRKEPKLVERPQRNLEALLELQILRTKYGHLQQALRFNVSCWDDDLKCGFTLYRELQRLLTNQMRLKERSLHDKTAAKENDELRISLGEAMVQLEKYKALSFRRLPAPTEITAASDLEVRVNELEEALKQALERLIEEQMQREIDQTKWTMLLTGVRRQSQSMREQLEKLRAENELLKKKLEELLKSLTACRTKENELQRVLHAKEEELRDATKVSARRETEIEELKTENASMKQRIVALEKEVTDLEKRALLEGREIRDLRREVKDAEEKAKRAQEREQAALEALEERESERRKLEGELESLAFELDQLQKRLERENSQWTLKLEALERQRSELQERLRISEGRCCELLLQLDETKRLFERERDELSGKIKELQQQLGSMTEEATRITSEWSMLQDEGNTLKGKIRHLTNQLADEKAKQKMPATLSRGRYVTVEIKARPKILREHRSTVYVEHFPKRHPPSYQKLRPISFLPVKRVLARQKTQKVFLAREVPSPPKRAAPVSIAPKVTGPPKQLLSPAQARLLAGTEAASGELLRSKPSAEELVAVAITGAQQQRQRSPRGGPQLSPMGSSATLLSPKASGSGRLSDE